MRSPRRIPWLAAALTAVAWLLTTAAASLALMSPVLDAPAQLTGPETRVWDFEFVDVEQRQCVQYFSRGLPVVYHEHTYFVGDSGVWVHNDCETRARVLSNIAESRRARTSSNFRTPASRDRQIGADVSASPGGGRSLFRGTSSGFESPTSARLGITPASTDPVVATIFARHSDNFGKGVLQVAGPHDLVDVDILEGNVLRALEREVGVALKPSEFAARAGTTVTSGQAVDALKQLGVSIPRVGRSPGAVQSALENTPRLSNDQIRQFLEIVGGQ